MKALIVDDEAPARKRMIRLLSGFKQVEVISEAENGLEALEKINELSPDIVFLDIEMPGLNGLEVVEQLDAEELPNIVFATAYNEHALKAFELNAVDYLLKPFAEGRLAQCLEKIEKRQQEGGGFQKEKLQELQKQLEVPFSSKIPVSVADRYRLIDYDEVACIEVEDRSTLLYTADKTYIMNFTLDYFEKKLPSEKFLRVNRSAIIGLLHIKEIVIWFGNRFKIILNNGKEIISSREKSKILKQVLKF